MACCTVSLPILPCSARALSAITAIAGQLHGRKDRGLVAVVLQHDPTPAVDEIRMARTAAVGDGKRGPHGSVIPDVGGPGALRSVFSFSRQDRPAGVSVVQERPLVIQGLEPASEAGETP